MEERNFLWFQEFPYASLPILGYVSINQNQPEDIDFLVTFPHNFNRKPIVPCGLKYINATCLHRRSRLKPMFAGA